MKFIYIWVFNFSSHRLCTLISQSFAMTHLEAQDQWQNTYIHDDGKCKHGTGITKTKNEITNTHKGRMRWEFNVGNFILYLRAIFDTDKTFFYHTLQWQCWRWWQSKVSGGVYIRKHSFSFIFSRILLSCVATRVSS